MASSSPLLAAIGKMSDKGDKKTRKDPVKKRAKTGEKPVAETGQQHGALPTYKEPTPAQRMKEGAGHAKVRATMDWIDGRISTKAHTEAHRRANHVMRNARALTGKNPSPKMPAQGDMPKGKPSEGKQKS